MGKDKTPAFDEVICCGQKDKTAAFDDPQEYMLRATKKIAAFVDYFFSNSFSYLLMRILKIAAND